MDNNPIHIDDWIEDYEAGDECQLYAKWFLHHKRLPAMVMLMFEPIMRNFALYCEYEGTTYRVTGASRMGDVWLTSNFEQCDGYEKRVEVDGCSKWSAYSDKISVPRFEKLV